jgi:molybdate transport system permease protein
MRCALTTLSLLAALCAVAPARALADDGAPPEEVRVLAASSLTDVLQTLVARYAEETGRPAPILVLASSSRLARQLQEGAPAHVVLTADEAWMDALEQSGHVLPATRRALLTNRLVVVVPKGASLRPSAPQGLLDLERIAVGAEAVPAGRRAREALGSHGLLEGLEPRLVSSPSVRAALALVARGEVGGGIVYATDAQASPHVDVAFEFSAGSHRPIRYPIALTLRGADSDAAHSFAEYLRGPDAQAVFESYGFGVPGTGEPAHSDAPGPRARADWLHPLGLSLGVALVALLVSLVPAIAAGWFLARREFLGKSLVSTALLIPMVLPPVVTGYLLLGAFGRNGPLGGLLDAVGLQVAFTRWGAVVAAAVVGFPLLVLSVRLAIESVDPRYEQLAETLGQTPLGAFWRVTLPMALPGLAAGCVLAFARGLGEFGATAILASDVPGETRTLALAVFALYEQPGGEAAARTLVWISIALCLVALIGYERLSRAQRRRIEAIG